MSVCLTVSNMVLYVSVTCGLRVVYVQVSDLEIWVCFVLLSVTTCVHPPTHTHTLATHTAAPPPHSASKAMVFQDKTSKSNPSLEAASLAPPRSTYLYARTLLTIIGHSRTYFTKVSSESETVSS